MDELTCDNVGCSGCQEGLWIVEFVSCGAKNYGYQLNTGQITCKVRGFSLNYNASQTLNLNSMREAIECWMKGITPPELITTKTLILGNRLKACVYIPKMPKHYGAVHNKRRVLEYYYTLPYGYVEMWLYMRKCAISYSANIL